MDYTHPHTPIPSPEAFDRAKQNGLIFVTVAYKPADDDVRATSIFVEVIPRIGEMLIIEEKKYSVLNVVHRIQAAVPEEIEDFFSTVPRLLAVEIEEEEDEE